VTSGHDTLWLWDVPTRTERLALHGHKGQIRGVAFSPDGAWVATAANDHTDPAWDIAGVLHDYLDFWTGTMPLDPTRSPQEMVSLAQWPLEAIQPALRAFWRAYVGASRWAGDGSQAESDALLRRGVRFSGVRLILAAIERCFERDEVPVQAILLLQIAVNLLAAPDPAMTALYGLEPAAVEP